MNKTWVPKLIFIAPIVFVVLMVVGLKVGHDIWDFRVNTEEKLVAWSKRVVSGEISYVTNDDRGFKCINQAVLSGDFVLGHYTVPLPSFPPEYNFCCEGREPDRQLPCTYRQKNARYFSTTLWWIILISVTLMYAVFLAILILASKYGKRQEAKRRVQKDVPLLAKPDQHLQPKESA